MVLRILVFVLIIILIGCNTNTKSVDYFGQPEPESTPVLFAEGIISVKGRLEHGITFTPSARELAFGVLNKESFKGEIHYSKKTNGKWTSPGIFKPLENNSVFLPYFSPDGKSLVYTQSKWDSALHFKDLWMIEKNNGMWSNPEKMKIPLPSLASVSNACLSLDRTLYFSSNINCIGKENYHTADLFYSNIINNEYKSVEVINEFKSTNDEESVFISPQEDYIIFCRFTNRDTWMDLYISYRDVHNNWLKPQILDSTINSQDWDRRPFVTIDNKFLFFTRLQIGNKGLTESDIYWVNTSKVFKPFVYNRVPNIELQVGEKFELIIPTDYFKDVDDQELEVSINQNEFDWLAFDNKKMKLSGVPTKEGNFELIFTAMDRFSNKTQDKVKIKVNNL